jgi:hypothetical protein
MSHHMLAQLNNVILSGAEVLPSVSQTHERALA